MCRLTFTMVSNENTKLALNLMFMAGIIDVPQIGATDVSAALIQSYNRGTTFELLSVNQYGLSNDTHIAKRVIGKGFQKLYIF